MTLQTLTQSDDRSGLNTPVVAPDETRRASRVARSMSALKAVADTVYRTPWLRYTLLALAALNFFYTVFLITNPDCGSGEAFNYWSAARRVALGQKLYQPWPDYGPHILTSVKYNYGADRFPYPPPLAALLAPTYTKSFPFFQRWWTYLMFVCFWVYAGCLSAMFSKKLSLEGVLNAGLLLCLTPGSRLPFLTGIADPLMWMLFGLAATTRFGGVAFLASAWIKLYAGWPFVFALLRERKRMMWQGVLTLLGGFALGVAVCGLGAFRDWAVYYLPVVGQGTFSEHNYSLSMDGLRLFRLIGWHYSIGPLPAWARLWLTSVEFFVPLAVGVLTRKRGPKLQCACVGVAAAACAPLFWVSYVPLFLTPLALFVREEWDAIETRSPSAALEPDANRESLADFPQPVPAG